MAAHAHVLHMIRLRRAQTAGRPKRRKRLPRQVYPHALERQYVADAVGLVARIQASVRAYVLPRLEGWLAQGRRERGDALGAYRSDAVGKDIRELLQRIKDGTLGRQLTDEEVEAVAARLGRQTANFQKEQLNKQLKAATGVDVLTNDTGLKGRLEGWAHSNVQLIQSVPTRLLDEVEYQVLDGVGRNARSEEVAHDIQERFGVSDSRAELIARDQIGKLYGQLNEDRQTALGLSGYIWRTALDERVRPSHQDMEGEACTWDDPPVVDGEAVNPGEPIQCRCYAEPNVEEILDGLDE